MTRQRAPMAKVVALFPDGTSQTIVLVGDEEQRRDKLADLTDIEAIQPMPLIVERHDRVGTLWIQQDFAGQRLNEIASALSHSIVFGAAVISGLPDGDKWMTNIEEGVKWRIDQLVRTHGAPPLVSYETAVDLYGTGKAAMLDLGGGIER